MSAKRSVSIVIGVIVLVVTFIFLRQPSIFLGFLGIDWSKYLCIIINDVLLRIIVIVLTVTVALLSFGIYLASKESPSHNATEAPSKGKGRPRKPCSLAVSGLMECPLQTSDIKPPPKLVAAVAKELDIPFKTEKEKVKRKKPEKSDEQEKPTKKGAKKIGRFLLEILQSQRDKT